MPEKIEAFSLSRDTFINYSPKLKQLVITRKGRTNKRQFVFNEIETVRMRVYLNDLLKKGL